MSKPTENDLHLWIGDMLPTTYEAALIIFHYSKKVPYERQSLISMQKLYIIQYVLKITGHFLARVIYFLVFFVKCKTVKCNFRVFLSKKYKRKN